MPQSAEVHTCSRCGDTVTSDSSPPAGWIISISWTSPENDVTKCDDLKRHEICPKHFDEMRRQYLAEQGQLLEREVQKYNAEVKRLGGAHA